MEQVRDLAALAGAIFGAILGGAGVVALVARIAWKATIGPRFAAMEQTIHTELRPNGRENEADPEDRGVPVRTVVARTAQRTRLLGEWTRRHELEHVRVDPEWPASYR